MAQRNRRPNDTIADLDRVAGVVRCNAVAKLFDAADSLMSQDDGERHNSRFTRCDVDIAAAHATEDDADERSAGRRIHQRNVPRFNAIGLHKHRGPIAGHGRTPLMNKSVSPSSNSYGLPRNAQQARRYRPYFTLLERTFG